MARARARNGKDDEERNNFTIADQQNQALFYHHKRKYKAALAEKKVADAHFKNVCKKAVADLGDGVVEDIKDSIGWEKKGGESMVKAAFERLARLSRWMGFKVGVQAELFNDAPKQPTPYDRGYLAGMEGHEPSPPYDPGSQEANEWMTGFHEGTAKINDIIAMKDRAEHEADEGDETEETGPDDEEDGDGDAPPPLGDQEATSQLKH